MRKLIILFNLAVASCFAVKNPHPRIWLTNSVVTTLQQEALAKTLGWEQFRSDVDTIVAAQTGGSACTAAAGAYGGSNGADYGQPLAQMAIILGGSPTAGIAAISGTVDAKYTAAQYANCSAVLMESFHTGYVVPSCPGEVYTGCNSTTAPPAVNGNIMRDQFKKYALVWDWLMGSVQPPTTTQQTDWMNDLHQSGLAVLCTTGCSSLANQNYTVGTGPAQNVGEGVWSTTYMIGVATSGNNPTDSTTCPTYGTIHEANCNAETSGYLQEFVNAEIPWWTPNTLGPNNTNRCQPPNATQVGGTTYGGGSGCGVGGAYTDALEYYPAAQQYVINVLLTAATADTPSINLLGQLPASFVNDQITFNLYMTAPSWSQRAYSGVNMYDWENQGDQQTPYQLDDGAVQTNMQMLASMAGTSAQAAYARFWADNIYKNQSTGATLYGIYPGHSSTYTSWEYFLFEDTTGLPRTDWRIAGPSAYHVSGEDILFSFATPKGHTCTNSYCANATWAMFENREDSSNHAHPMSGEFIIYRESAFLALSPPGYTLYSDSGDVHNVAMYQGPTELAGGFFRGPEVFPKSFVSEFNIAFETTANYVYSAVDTTGIYKNLYEKTNPLKVQREWIQFFPDRFIVLDRGNFAGATTGRFQFNTPAESAGAPTVVGAVTTMNVTGNRDGLGGPNQVLFVNSLYPTGNVVSTQSYAGGIPTIHTQSTSYAYGSVTFPSTGVDYLTENWYRYTSDTPSTSTNIVMLNVMEAADVGAAATPSEVITATGIICAHWKDIIEDQIACFSSSTTNAVLTFPVSYSYAPAATTGTNLIVDLPASTNVTVEVTPGVLNTITINSSEGTGIFMTTSANGTLVIPISAVLPPTFLLAIPH